MFFFLFEIDNFLHICYYELEFKEERSEKMVYSTKNIDNSFNLIVAKKEVIKCISFSHFEV